MSEPEVIIERRGAAGTLLLNRPKALNALTLGMVRAIAAALDDFEADPAIERVVIAGAGDRAFCAGGDIRLMHDLGRAGDHAAQLSFWREEYRLNRRIRRYPKPYVALIDGIVMGGGVGVSLHGSHRIAGDRYVFAMPEAGIGFFPDVGATYALPRLPGAAGTYFALTGARAKAADGVALGLATAYVPPERFGALEAALTRSGDTDAIIAEFAAKSPPSFIAGERLVIDRCFGAETLVEILGRLDRAAGLSPFAGESAAAMRQKSPTSLAIALRQMRLGAGLAMEAALQVEMRIVARICRGHDFYEGVRALLIDRDNAPQWHPSAIEAADSASIEPYFAPLGADGSTFPDIALNRTGSP